MPPRLRVLMISKACIVGIYQRKLEYIAREDINLNVIVPPYWRDSRGVMPLERVYTQGYRLESLPVRLNGNYHLHYYVGLRRRIRGFRPDIIHIDEEPYNRATWQALRNALNLGGIRTLFFTWQNIERRYPPPFGWGERWVMRSVNYALAGTHSAAEVLRAKGYDGPLRVIPQFGTDVDLFQPAEERPLRPFTIGYVGRLVEEKGIHHLLEAAARLEGAWALRVLGGGPLRKSLETQAASLGIRDRVTFDPQIPSAEVPAYYHQLDALVLPSLTRPNWKEQFGRVLLEAMASGVPVIGSDSGAIPGVMGAAGLVFPEGDIQALTEQLRLLRDDPGLYAHLRAAGRAHVLQHYTHQQIALDTVQVYREMTGLA
ncbi:MAG: glycosyltransferase family 4 protein [Anaerolineae bacterium]